MCLSTERPLLIRADANIQIGTGHVMRCLALAQAWQEAGGAAHFAVVDMPGQLRDRLISEGIEIHQLDATRESSADAVMVASLASYLGAEWVVADGYHFGSTYQRIIKEADLRLLAIDDYSHADHYLADLVLNQNINAVASLYPSRETYTRLLLGTRYSLLRREFWRWRGNSRKAKGTAGRVLVTFGGSDPDNLSLTVITALREPEYHDMEVRIVIGAGNPHYGQLLDAVSNSSAIQVVRNVADMSEQMNWAEMAVTAAGSTSWELAFMGVPSISLIVAENQARAARQLDEMGIIRCLGPSQNVDSQRISQAVSWLSADLSARSAMIEKGKRLVDGNGVFRVVQQIMDKLRNGNSFEGNST